jgi:hypothetical protein
MTASTDGPTASQRITAEVTSWPGVVAGPGRRGEFAFTVGGRALGHLHGDRAAHFSFPRTVWGGAACARPYHRSPGLPRQARPGRAPH